MYTCIDKSMQIVLERGSIDTYVILLYACKGVFNPNIPIFPPNSAEVWMTILESGWNLWVWLVGVVSMRWVWLVGGIYGYGYHV